MTRVTVTMPLPAYLELVRHTKGKERVSAWVQRAIAHCLAHDQQSGEHRQLQLINPTHNLDE